jgi:hypothetical protein
MVTLGSEPGLLLEVITSIPATLPCKACCVLDMGSSDTSLEEMEEIAPVNWLFLCVP